MKSQATPRASDALIIFLYVPFALLVGVCLAVPVYDWAIASDSSLAHELLRKGPGRLTRRCMMVVAIVLIPLLLRAVDWQGRKDCGWTYPPHNPGKRKNDFFRGLFFGLGIMLILFAASLLLGTRCWNMAYSTPKTIFSLFSFGMGALAVGIFEETLARGILYRKLALRWSPILVMIIVAIAFAWMHFLQAEPELFKSGSYGERVWNIFRSSVTGFMREPSALIEMLNLSLFSVLLCLMLLKSGSIWLPAGFHAGVVLIKRLNGILADGVADHRLTPWIGRHSDYLDGWLCAALLIGLIVFIGNASRRTVLD